MPHNGMVQNITSIGVTTSDCRTEAGPTLLWMDAGAGDSASSGGHCELKYNRVHSRLHPRERQTRTTSRCMVPRCSATSSGMSYSIRGGERLRGPPRGSSVVLPSVLLRRASCILHTRYTICARRGMSTLAEGAALRANLGRLCSSARELTGARTTGARTRRAEARPQDHGLGLAVVCTLQHWGCGHTPSLETCVPRQRSCTCGR